MPHLLAAPDKFRGTAAAGEVAAAAAAGARSAGWSADERPLADGGEGTLDVLSHALGGERRHTAARGPGGESVEAEWLLLPVGLPERELVHELSGILSRPGGPYDEPVAVIESARAAGQGLLPSPRGDDPMRARSDGVGDLILDAVDAGARIVVVGVGGTSTTDGGVGVVSTVGSRDRLRGALIVVACDVTTPFRLAAEVFAPQKGATPAQVQTLRARLDSLVDRYRGEFGVDVDALPGAGAGGGIAGGLAALGAHLVPGFTLVGSLVDLDRHAAAADLVVTGEGHLDATSFAGKVVGGVLGAAGGIPPALCIAGDVEDGVERFWTGRRGAVEAVSLTSAVGAARARTDVTGAVFDVVAATCRRPPAGLQTGCR